MTQAKEYEVRKNEILDYSEELFFTKGYSKTTIVDILNKTKIAKGTFYYYFKSKEEVLNEIVKRIVDKNITKAEEIIDNKKIPTKEKFLKVLISQNLKNTINEKILEIIHQPENAKLNQKSLKELTEKLTPVLAKLVRQGIKEGIFETPYPEESIEFIIISSTYFFDDEKNNEKRTNAFIRIMEKTLGTEEGAMEKLKNLIK